MHSLGLFVLAATLIAWSGCRSADEPAPKPVEDAATVAATPEWVEDAVIYEIYLRSFTPEGTFRAVIPRLDELQALGVTVLWLMPIHPIGEARKKGVLGSPYAIRDYKDVNPRFGTMDDFQALVDEVHERGMRIIIDLVANHTAWDNAWVEAHPEWYTADSTGTIIHPDGTDWTDVADLDYENPDLREAMRGAMRFWVENVGIDGYRCDVADLVPMDFWSEAIDELRAIKPVLMLAEGGRPELYAAGFDLVYGWDTYNALKAIWRGTPADTLFTVLTAEAANYPTGTDRMRFTTNHDETAWDATPLTLFGGAEGAKAAAAIAATLPGAFLLYNGQEVADTQQLPLFEKVDIDWSRDPVMRAFYDDLLDQRAATKALDGDRVEPIPHEASSDLIAFYRIADADTALVTVNVRDREVTTTLPGMEPMTLPPYGWRIETMSGVE